jgi:hypothetical protein
VNLMPQYDDDGYPTDDTVKTIEDWPYQDITGALDFVAAAWHWPDFVSYELSAHEAGVLRADPGDRYLRLATGGWSGNETLIAALRTNRMIHALSWRLDAVGGLHIYEYPRKAH